MNVRTITVVISLLMVALPAHAHVVAIADNTGASNEAEALAESLTDRAEATPDVAVAAQAVAAWQRLVVEQSPEKDPATWAHVKNNLGRSLTVLAQHSNKPEFFDAAIKTHREVLAVLRRHDFPTEWWRSKALLGLALTNRSSMSQTADGLVEAVIALRLALEEADRGKAAYNWAITQINYGDALSGLVELGPSPSELARVPAMLAEAETSSPIDAVLRKYRNTSEQQQTLLEAAIRAQRLALSVLTRGTAPFDWARAENNLGTALTIYGGLIALRDRPAGVATLHEAVDAFTAALTIRARDANLLTWSMTQNQLGWALFLLGGLEPNADRLRESVAAFDDAISGLEQLRLSKFTAIARSNRAMVMRLIESRQRSTRRS